MKPYDASTCWFCTQPFDQPWKALKVQGAATLGRIYAFCGLDCLSGWITELRASSRREKPKAQGKTYSEVVLQGGKLVVVPPKTVIPYNTHVELSIIPSRCSPTPACPGWKLQGGRGGGSGISAALSPPNETR